MQSAIGYVTQTGSVTKLNGFVGTAHSWSGIQSRTKNYELEELSLSWSWTD